MTTKFHNLIDERIKNKDYNVRGEETTYDILHDTLLNLLNDSNGTNINENNITKAINQLDNFKESLKNCVHQKEIIDNEIDKTTNDMTVIQKKIVAEKSNIHALKRELLRAQNYKKNHIEYEILSRKINELQTKQSLESALEKKKDEIGNLEEEDSNLIQQIVLRTEVLTKIKKDIQTLQKMI